MGRFNNDGANDSMDQSLRELFGPDEEDDVTPVEPEPVEEALLISPPQAQPLRPLTATERLALARKTADLARRQVDAQPDAPSYP